MMVLEAPMLAGSRSRAREVADQLPEDLTGTPVELDCHDVLAVAVSFVDELISQVLVERHASELRVVRASDPDFIRYLEERAASHGVTERLHFDS